MIAHVVLFQPRSDLRAAEREAFAAAFEHALTSIPQVRRARVGARRIMGRQYDQQNRSEFSFVAILEFDSEADLRTYLDHPAHDELGRQFYGTAESALAYDFELTEGAGVSGVFNASDPEERGHETTKGHENRNSKSEDID